MSPAHLVLVAVLSLFAAGASTSVQAPAQAAVQTVTLYSYGYAPATIRLRAGQPVTLAFVNRSGNAHDFTAPAFFARSRILAGDVARGEIELRGGRSASVALVPARGTYPVHCGHFLHKQLGMKGKIIVE